jgi:hypothetical protein
MTAQRYNMCFIMPRLRVQVRLAMGGRKWQLTLNTFSKWSFNQEQSDFRKIKMASKTTIAIKHLKQNNQWY